MVKLNTILALGGIAAAYFIFKNLGGASGIGSKIGGGFSSFGTSLSESLSPLSEAFAQKSPQLDMVYEDYLQGKPTPNTLPFDENPSFKIVPQDEPASTAVAPVPNAFEFDNFYNKYISPNLPSLPNVYASESPQAQNFFAGQRAITRDASSRFPSARTATSSERSTLSSLTGGLLG
tara:strand:- start:116 stop:646 length:531 start_codon:yes stop_codon:yes gene_type:complete